MNLQVATNSEVVTVSAEGTPRPPNAAGQNETDIKIGGKVQPGRRVRVVQPNYPQSAKDQGITGAVVIQALIGKSGKMLRATVVNDAPGQLKDAALAAVQQWEYTPALLNGEPVDTMTTVTVNFQLDPQ
jgi:TonB family protein